MSRPSNIYAERVFSEHPLALWALDDDASYLSLMSENNRQMSSWTITGGTKSISVSDVDRPIEGSSLIKITPSDTQLTILESVEPVSSSLLIPEYSKFNVSTYFYSTTSLINSVTVECLYIDPNTSEEVSQSKSFSIITSKIWSFLSHSFDIPEQNVDIYFRISIAMSGASSESVYFNGLSVGQLNDQTMTESVGAISVSATSENVAIDPALYISPASPYGISDKLGYYVSSRQQLYSENLGFPMVYGSDNVTKISPNPYGPSLIIPAFGFLNESGKNKNLTLEFWINVSPDTNDPVRIVGPIGSRDGLYVDGSHLTLKIGNDLSSKFIGSWNRPMLIHIRVQNDIASVLINGEQAISMSYSAEGLSSIVDSYLGSLTYGKSQDWIGFYSSETLGSMQIDVPAIYSYIVSEVVAKRRFIYGQGVQFPDIVNTAYGGTSATIDYRVSEYSNNYLYPDMGRWSNGILENFVVDNDILSTPQYSPPKIVLNESTNTAWLSASKTVNQLSSDAKTFIDLSLASSNGGYLFIDNLNVLQQDVKAIYGSFRSNSLNKQTLFRIEDEVTKQYFLAELSGSIISYKLYSKDNVELAGVENAEHILGLSFVAGINIDKFSNVYGKSIATFFGSRNRLKVYFGGQSTFENTFSGRIYNIGICSQRNLNKISSLFKEDGTIANELDTFNEYIIGNTTELSGGDPDTTFIEFFDGGSPDTFSSAKIYDHVASYTASPQLYLDAFSIKVVSSSSWQDYVPLKHFAKFTGNKDGTKSYRLSYLQFNLDNPVIKNISNQTYDTSTNSVKTYISFQYNYSGANNLFEDIPSKVSLSETNSVVPGSNWEYEKYEVVDGTTIQVPSGISFDKLSIVIHIEANTVSDSTKSVNFKRLQIAGQALHSDRFTKINTAFGVGLYPYRQSGVYYDYDGYNPVSIQKDSTPYLHLTDTSGISLSGDISVGRGIYMQVNPTASEDFKLGAMQLLAKYRKKTFSSTPELISTISAIDKTLNIYVVASSESSNVGVLYVTNVRTGLPENGVSIYINGVLASRAIIRSEEWTMIGIQFANSLEFSEFSGTVSINGNILVNNLSTYRLSSLQSAVTSVFRLWSELPTILAGEGIPEATWNDLLTHVPVITWQNVLYIPSVKTYLIDPKIIFKTYTGTNKVIVKDSSIVTFKKYAYNTYKDVAWTNSIVSPV